MTSARPVRQRLAGQPDEPNGIGTLMTCTRLQAVAPAASRQTDSVETVLASASTSESGPATRVAVRAGRAVSGCHDPPGPARVTPRSAFRVIASLPCEPRDAERS